MIRYGTFQDYYRGDGSFIAAGIGSHHILVAIRRKWNLAFTRPNGKPQYRRLYIGPFEIEVS